MSERNTTLEGKDSLHFGFFEREELESLEKSHPDGVTAKHVVELFTARGMKVSEATFRKYVQLGLLPRSRRVRVPGKRRGSVGMYPVSVVSRINEIKKLLGDDLTMDEIRERFLCATSEIDELEESLARVFGRLEKALSERAEAEDQADLLRRDLDEARRAAAALTVALRRLEEGLGARARLDKRTAV